jgi:hypothetical protein
VLVLVPGKVVGSVHVSSDVVIWEGISIDFFPSVDFKWLLSVLEGSFSNSASTFGHEKISFWDNFGVRCLVSWIVLLLVSSDMLGVISPGILWSGPSAISFNSNVVDTSDDSDESIFTVMTIPRVSEGPVFSSISVNTVSEAEIS